MTARPACPLCDGGDALLLLGDGAAARLHLLHEVFLDLALRALRGLREARQLLVVGLPALGIEQPLGFLDLALLRQRADVGDDAADLVGGADLGGALALLGREDGVEMRVEGEEHRGRHGGQEHHPQHGILDDQAQALHVRASRCRRRAGSRRRACRAAPARAGSRPTRRRTCTMSALTPVLVRLTALFWCRIQ